MLRTIALICLTLASAGVIAGQISQQLSAQAAPAAR
jgi:hypothetical protein